MRDKASTITCTWVSGVGCNTVDALTQLLQEHPANIAVRADKQVTYQDLDKVLDTLRAAGFSTINLFTLTTEAS